MAWVTKHLGDIVVLQRGFDLAKSKRTPGPFPILSAGKQGGTHVNAKVEGPGFAIGRATNLGKPQWSESDYWPLNTTLFAKDFKGNNPRWLFHLFEILDLTGYDSGSVQPMLNRNYIEKVPVRVPPRDVQNAIVEVLGALDDKIAANQRAASLSRQMVESIAETTNNYVSLDELAVRNKRTINPAKLGSDLVMHYSIPRFDSGSPALEPADSIKSNKMHVERASVLVSKLNPETPRVWSIPAPSKEPLSLASTEFIVLEPSDINQSQLYAATLHSNFHHQLASLVGGTSKSHQRVKPTEMLGCVVPDVRTLTDEQIELLKTLVQIETQAIQEAETLAKTRDELLPLLMSGKITVREASQEAAAAGAPTPSEEDEV